MPGLQSRILKCPGIQLKSVMTRCDHCGNEVVLPFSCQYCGGKYCPDCRLPPNHTCVNIALWNSKAPSCRRGILQERRGSDSPRAVDISQTPGTFQKRNRDRAIPYLKIMIAAIVLILLGFAWLVFSGYHIG